MAADASSTVTVIATDAAAGRAHEHPRRHLELFLAPTYASERVPFNTVRPGLRTVACWRMDDVRFEFDSSFVRPEAKRELAMLADIAATVPESPVALFGHADPIGTEAYNKALSGRRALAIYGLVTRDLDVWERLFSKPFGSDQWGDRALRTMLGTVASPSTGQPYDTTGPLTTAARAYQAEHGLSPDGIVGPVTRRALFAD